MAVIDALLATGRNEEPSPYAVRALTRDLNSKQAQELTARGVECVKGKSSKVTKKDSLNFFSLSKARSKIFLSYAKHYKDATVLG